MFSPGPAAAEGTQVAAYGNQLPGVYELALPTQDQFASGAFLDSPCTEQSLSGQAYLAPGAQCQIIAGGTAGNATTGAANGGFNWTVLAQSSLDGFGDVAAGTWGGQGAFVLPWKPTHLESLFAGLKGKLIPWSGTLSASEIASNPGLSWRTGYAAAYFRNATMAPLSTLDGIPAWLRPQLNLTQPGNLVQKVRLPADVYSAGLGTIPVAPGELTLAFAADEPAAPLRFLANTTGGTFTVGLDMTNPRGALAAARVHVDLTTAGAMPPGTRMQLNGHPFGPDLATLAGRGSFTALSGDVLAGTNTLTCTGDCTSAITAVEASLGAFSQANLMGDDGGASAWAGLDWQGPSSRRHAVWAVVALVDSGRFTRVRLNGSPWRVVQDGGVAVNDQGHTVYRVLVDARELDHGPNRLDFDTTPCAAARCDGKANVATAWVLAEYSEDAQVCAPSQERCGDGVDNDCDGRTDEAGTDLCDGNDADGCALGTPTCDASQTCDDRDRVPPLTGALTELTLTIDTVDLLTSVQAVRLHPNLQISLVSALTEGIDLGVVSAMMPTPPAADEKLMRIDFHLSADAQGKFADGSTHPVALRSRPTDDGRTLRFNLGSGTPIGQDQPLLVMVSPSNALPLTSVYGCPGGTYTYPPEVDVINLCDLSAVACGPDHGSGSWCDTAPQTPWCSTCTGDWDGCADGVATAVGNDHSQCWADTNPNGPGGNAPIALTMDVTNVTWDFGGNTFTAAVAPPVQVDLLALAMMHPNALAALTVPVLAGNPVLTEVELQGTARATMPGGATSVPVALRSGMRESGTRLRLTVANGGQLPGGSPLQVIATATPGVDYGRVYSCTDGTWTFASWLPVAPVVLPPGGVATGPQPPPVQAGLLPCNDSTFPSQLRGELTSLTFCYDDQSCLDLPVPPGTQLDLLSMLAGDDVFGGMHVPQPPTGGQAHYLTSLRVRGSFGGLAFDPNMQVGFTPMLLPMFVDSPTANPQGDGILFNFLPDARPAVLAPLRLRLAPGAMADERVYDCPTGRVQIGAIVEVSQYLPAP